MQMQCSHRIGVVTIISDLAIIECVKVKVTKDFLRHLYFYFSLFTTWVKYGAIPHCD